MATNQISTQARSFRFSFDDHAVIAQAMAQAPTGGDSAERCAGGNRKNQQSPERNGNDI